MLGIQLLAPEKDDPGALAGGGDLEDGAEGCLGLQRHDGVTGPAIDVDGVQHREQELASLLSVGRAPEPGQVHKQLPSLLGSGGLGDHQGLQLHLQEALLAVVLLVGEEAVDIGPGKAPQPLLDPLALLLDPFIRP